VAMSAWASWVASEVSSLAALSRLRSLRTLHPLNGSPLKVAVETRTLRSMLMNEPSVGGAPDLRRASCEASAPAGAMHELTIFAANDYLGLSGHAETRAAAAQAAAAHGSGPRASALVCGYTQMHRELERSLAELTGCDEVLLYPSGFAANLSVIGALADSADVAVFSDELNHASIVDGARLAARGAGAALHVYRHNDLNHLEALLAACTAPRKLIVSDALFSMDGDLADCKGLVTLRQRYGALLCLDEAHATLVFGHRGGGVAQAMGVERQVDVHVGTLSKAVGSQGGFVGCSSPMKQLLLSKGRAGIYSTAMPLPSVAAARAAIRLATPQLRQRLRANLDVFADAIGASVTSPIVPIVVGDEESALAASAELLRAGFLVPAIRPPTVPKGSARLRVALSAAHEPADLHALARALHTVVRGLPGSARAGSGAESAPASYRLGAPRPPREGIHIPNSLI